MNRRHFIQTTSLSLAALIICDPLRALPKSGSNALMVFPDKIWALINGQTVPLAKDGKLEWRYKDLLVKIANKANILTVQANAPSHALSELVLEWKTPDKKASMLLNDHWERTYGDASWHSPSGTEILPWYFMIHNGMETNGFGVKTGAHSFCSWQWKPKTLSLTLDTRSGGDGVQLGDRTLHAAEIVTIQSQSNETAFQTAKRFTHLMCDKARMPKAPVYGINDWYFSYGNTSEKLILEHTGLMAPMAEGLSNRPFSVIDAGWFQGPPSMPNDCCWGDNMNTPDKNFSDMGRLAEQIQSMGMRPGIWTRPLCASYKDATTLTLPFISGRERNKPVLDPTLPENLERIRNYFKLYQQWGYEMVKFDFTTYDLFGKWGFDMLKDRAITAPSWKMHDNTRTNAEIVLTMYQTIREAAGDIYIIGCNTFSHLSAGLFELNRIGDDTSGNEWDRTQKMGVNALAFRGIHHGSFYAADADCVGLTTKVPWEKNKQWMELVAKSGTPLFISAQPNATGTVQKETIKECFLLASQELPLGEPLDWMETLVPKKWKLNGVTETFNWG